VLQYVEDHKVGGEKGKIHTHLFKWHKSIKEGGKVQGGGGWESPFIKKGIFEVENLTSRELEIVSYLDCFL